MHLIDIPQAAKTLEDFSPNDQAVIQRLDQIFWSEIPKMFVGKFLVDVVTVGGEQKAEAIRDVVKRLDGDLADVMYVGDSITDVEAFKLVRDNGGLTISFNGNGYAINAEVAVLSESNLVTAVIAELFCKFGKEVAINALQSWGFPALEYSEVDAGLLKQFSNVYPNGLPKAQIVTAQNMELLIKESSEFRKGVRGVAVQKLDKWVKRQLKIRLQKLSMAFFARVIVTADDEETLHKAAEDSTATPSIVIGRTEG